jgi:hypothetical protein
VVGNGSAATATFVGFEAADADSLSLATMGGAIFVNQTTAIGTSANLGVFASGAEIEFKLTDLTETATFYTGPGSRNGDGLVHADVTNTPGAIPGFGGLSTASQNYALGLEASNPNYIFVGFEDRTGAQSDFDYNDLVFAVLNGTPAAVPEPVTLGVLGVGLLGLGLTRARRS